MMTVNFLERLHVMLQCLEREADSSLYRIYILRWSGTRHRERVAILPTSADGDARSLKESNLMPTDHYVLQAVWLYNLCA